MLAGLAVGIIAPATVAQAEPSAAEVQKQIDKASGELEDIVESYNKINEELKATQAAAKDLATKTADLELQVSDASAVVGELATTAYKTGRFGDGAALLTMKDNSDLLTGLGVLEQLAQTRNDEVSSFTATQQEFSEQKAQLDAAEKKQQSQKDEIAKRKSKIEADIKDLKALRKKAYGQEQASGSSYTGTVPSVSGSAGKAVSFAYAQIGKPYVYAADGPGSYDCSGLTLAAWAAAGKSLSHNAAMQWDQVSHISKSALQPGDLVFYRSLGHVAIYVGSGKVIHAPSTGDVVKLASYTMMTPYGYGRVK